MRNKKLLAIAKLIILMRWFLMLREQIEQIEKLKNTWYTVEEAVEELAVNGFKISIADFRRKAKKLNFDKEFALVGKPEIKTSATGRKGRPRKYYNHAAVESIRSFAFSNAYVKAIEEPIDVFIDHQWRERFRETLEETLSLYRNEKITPEVILHITDELYLFLDETIIKNYHNLVGQNKLLAHQKEVLDKRVVNYESIQNVLTERANELGSLKTFIEDDIRASSQTLVNKEVYHLKKSMSIENKLNTIIKVLGEINNDRDKDT